MQFDVVNSDETTHNIHPNPNNNREWNMTQPHGVPLEQSFAREEVAIPVKCNVAQAIPNIPRGIAAAISGKRFCSAKRVCRRAAASVLFSDSARCNSFSTCCSRVKTTLW